MATEALTPSEHLGRNVKNIGDFAAGTLDVSNIATVTASLAQTNSVSNVLKLTRMSSNGSGAAGIWPSSLE